MARHRSNRRPTLCRIVLCGPDNLTVPPCTWLCYQLRLARDKIATDVRPQGVLAAAHISNIEEGHIDLRSPIMIVISTNGDLNFDI